MFIIGELVNCTRKRVRAAAEARDAGYIKEIALKQADAGASMLDVNGGIAGQEAECLAWLVDVVQETVDLPLCLDSSDPDALRRALPVCKQRPMINSITDEPARLQAILPLLKEYRARVVALCMGTSGPPAGVEDRVLTAGRLVDRLTAEGIPFEDIYVDPCVLPVSTGPEHGRAVAEAIGQITTRYPG
ncbi:MAG: dihydropteroate synthase, partial [Bryobacteraceae bacterium]